MAKTTGPDLAASVVSPAMTAGAVSLLQGHLTAEENELWTSLGQNWTSSRSAFNIQYIWSILYISVWSNMIIELSQFTPRCLCSSIFTCVPGRVAASDIWLVWPASRGSHWVTTQAGCPQGKYTGPKCTEPGSGYRRFWVHWGSVSPVTKKWHKQSRIIITQVSVSVTKEECLCLQL